MLTPTNTNIIRCLRKKILYHSSIFKKSTSSTSRENNEQSNKQDSENQLKRWQEIEVSDKSNASKSLTLRFLEVLHSSQPFNPWSMAEFLKSKSNDMRKDLQRINPVVEECVGFELALAYFLVYQGGKVKFKGHDKWIRLNEDKTADLPKEYDPNYVVTEVDATEVELFYESLLNFRNAQRIKRAIFKRSPLFDDWFLDRISSYFPYLEYLDVSECPKLSERGLEALYRCSELKTIIITNYAKTAAFELTCLMLEDCVPGLKIEILNPQ